MMIQFTKGEASVLGLNGKATSVDVPMQQNKNSQGITPVPHPDLPVKVCGTILVREKSKKHSKAL